MSEIKKTLSKISQIKIQGASQVARKSLGLIKELVAKTKSKNRGQFIRKIEDLKKEILLLRPTEPLVSNFYYLVIQSLKTSEEKNIEKLINKKITEILKFYKTQENKIIKNGLKLIKSKDNIFTHCHSSVVEKVLIKAKKRGKNFSVYNTETRPLFQGRITARNLLKKGIKVTIVTDSAADFLVSDHSGDEVKINKVILGADVIGLDGSAVNKIGSFGMALTAWESKIPVYIVANLMKIDPKSSKGISLPLEKRKAKEIWPKAPKGLKINNYAFDFIPAKFITAFITEFGLLKPRQIGKKVKKEYPCLF